MELLALPDPALEALTAVLATCDQARLALTCKTLHARLTPSLEDTYRRLSTPERVRARARCGSLGCRGRVCNNHYFCIADGVGQGCGGAGRGLGDPDTPARGEWSVPRTTVTDFGKRAFSSSPAARWTDVECRCCGPGKRCTSGWTGATA
jgi:hypothetical protein